MIQSLRSADIDRLSELWNVTFPAKYRMNRDTIRRQILQCDLLIDSGSWATDDGFVALKRPGTPDWFPGQDETRCHIAAIGFSASETGLTLLERACQVAKESGYERVVFGMDPDHILPGCPTDAEGVKACLVSCGFVTSASCFDLERDLSNYSVPHRCTEALARCQANVRKCDPAEVSRLDAFLASTFPGRWRHDVMRKAALDNEPGSIDLLWLGSTIQGFAMTQVAGCQRPVSGACWSESLGENWGALGPIGISSDVRGKGLGDALLGLSLQRLKAEGARQTIIDWTTLDAFYGNHGFEVTRRYEQFVLEL